MIYYAEGDSVPSSGGRYTGTGGYAATLYLKIKANGDTTVALYVAATRDDDSAKAEVSREDEACPTGCGKILTKYYTNNIKTFDQNNRLNYGEVFDWKYVDISRGIPSALSSGKVVAYIQVFAVYRAMWTYQILENIRESSTGVLSYDISDYRLTASSDSTNTNITTYAAIGAVGVIFLCCIAAVFYFVGFDAAAAFCMIFGECFLSQMKQEREGMELAGFDDHGEPKEMIRPGFV